LPWTKSGKILEFRIWFSSRAIPGFFNYTYNMTMHKPEKSATSG
jgi:hypothetical protein